MKKKEIKKRYAQEVEAVEDVIETLSCALDDKGPHYKIIENENEAIGISREEFLEAIIE